MMDMALLMTNRVMIPMITAIAPLPKGKSRSLIRRPLTDTFLCPHMYIVGKVDDRTARVP